MKKISFITVLLLSLALPAGATNLNCVDISFLKTTPSSNPEKKQAIFQLKCHCAEGGYNVEAHLWTAKTSTPNLWEQNATANLSYFGPNQTAPTQQIFTYDPEGVSRFKVQIIHNGTIWGEKIVAIPPVWTKLKNPKLDKYKATAPKKVNIPKN